MGKSENGKEKILMKKGIRKRESVIARPVIGAGHGIMRDEPSYGSSS